MIGAARLEELCSIKTGKLDSNAAEANGEYPFFTCAQETFRINEYAFDTAAVLLGGNNANGVFPLKYFEGKFNAYQRTYILESLDRDVLDIRYLYYALKPALTHFQAASIGAATQYLTKPILGNFRVKLHHIDAQRRITDVMAAYDNLIGNNGRRIELLNQAAQMLYKEWFLSLRFPGHEHTDINDGVPIGWERKPLKNLSVFLKRGITPTYDEDAEGIVINQKCIRHRRINLNLARRQSKQVPAERFVQPGDILINSTGQGTLGRVAQVATSVPNCTVDTHVTIVRPSPGVSHRYLGLILMDWEPRFSQMGRGATNQTELSPTVIGETPIIVPPRMLLNEFESLIDPIFRQINILSLQSERA